MAVRNGEELKKLELNTLGTVDSANNFVYNQTFRRNNGDLQEVPDGTGEGQIKQTGNGNNLYIYKSNVDASRYRQELAAGDNPREVGPIFNGRSATSIGNVTEDTKMVYNGGAKSDGNGPDYKKYQVDDGYEKTAGDSVIRRESPYNLGSWSANAKRNG